MSVLKIPFRGVPGMNDQDGIFRQAVWTLKASRNFILLAVAVYCGAAVAGWIFAGDLTFIRLQFEELARRFEGLGPLAFVARIFVHNLAASYLAMCFIALWGIIPFFMAAFNGILLGWFAGWMQGITWTQMLFFLVPHGMFEWPAMFMAFGVGMWRGMGGFFSPHGVSRIQRWKRANYAYFVFVVPLLFVAAIIEGRYHFIEAFL